VRFRLNGKRTPQVGGRKESFPQLRAPPRSCYVMYSVPFRFSLKLTFAVRFFVPTEFDTRTTPFLFFISDYLSKHLSFFTPLNVGAHIILYALAVMPSDDDAFCLHLSHTTHTRVNSSLLTYKRPQSKLCGFNRYSIRIEAGFDGIECI
jgi:hypothetical protein